MKKSTIHSALDQLDELYIAEGIELYRQAFPKKHNRKILARILLISALLIFSCSLLLLPWLLTDNAPASSDPLPPASSINNSEESSNLPPSRYDPYTLVDFEILRWVLLSLLPRKCAKNLAGWKHGKWSRNFRSNHTSGI